MRLLNPTAVAYTEEDEAESEQEQEQPMSEIIAEAPQARPAQSTILPPKKAPEQQPTGMISTPVGKDEDRVVFAHVRFDAGIRKEFVTSLKKYLDYLESTLGGPEEALKK